MIRRLLDSPWTYFVAAGLLFLAAVASQFEVRDPSRPRGSVDDIVGLRDRTDLNVIFLLIDTLRADRLGAYGYERNTSPEIDALAHEGIVLRHVLSQSSWTKTSMASLWTGTYPINNGILRFDDALPEAAVLPAELFREAGFRTAGIWRNGWVAPNFGFSQGFEFYLSPKPGRERVRIQRGNPSSNPLQGTDEDLMTSAFEFLANFGRERFFLYMHFMDVHQYLFDQSAPDFGPTYSDSYDKSISWTDRLVRVLVNRLEELDLNSKTLLVIASDHGEAFREHGFEGHARNLYREVTEVPAIIVPPFALEQGIVVESRASNYDLWPTILDMVGLPPLPGADGVSLLPLILAAGGASPAPDVEGLERPVFAQLDRRWGTVKAESEPMVGVITDGYKLVVQVNNPETAEFYELSSDPEEKQNLFASDSPALAPARKLVDGYLEGAASPWGSEPDEVEIDAMRLNQLRALGYVIK